MRLVVLAAVVAAALSACSGGPGERASPGTTTTAPASRPVDDPSCPTFRGTTEQLTSTGERPDALLIDASAEMVGCLDRVTFTFESLGDGTPPGYEVRYHDVGAEPLFDGAEPIGLPGEAFLLVTITPASSNDRRLEGQPATYRGNLRLSYDASRHLTIVRKLADELGSVRWVIGLDGPRPFLVDSAENPTRVSVYIG